MGTASGIAIHAPLPGRVVFGAGGKALAEVFVFAADEDELHVR